MRKTAAVVENRKDSGRSAKPPIARRVRKGAFVTVYRIDSTGSPYIEGRAVIEGTCRRQHFFYVRFLGDKVCRVRFVHPDPDWQKNPERCLALLRTFWEASLAPPDFDEFFHSPTPKGDVS